MNLNKKIIILIILIIVDVSIYTVDTIIYKNISNDYNNNNSHSFIINEVIIVGDSRFELINNNKDTLKIPSNYTIDAKSGATINWLKQDGINKLNKILENKKEYHKYHIVFNLGVNDLNYDIDIKEKVDEYYNIYIDIVNQNKDINFYFLSINPVDENKIYTDFDINNKRTNEKIMKFNNTIKEKLNLVGVKYCDSYNEITFEAFDGLHYDSKTNQRIIDYINNKCIDFN